MPTTRISTPCARISAAEPVPSQPPKRRPHANQPSQPPAPECGLGLRAFPAAGAGGVFPAGLRALWRRHHPDRRPQRPVCQLYHRHVAPCARRRLFLQLLQAVRRQHPGPVCLLHEQPLQPGLPHLPRAGHSLCGPGSVCGAGGLHRRRLLLLSAAALQKRLPPFAGAQPGLQPVRLLCGV